jgi:hypothetical protein
LVSEKSSSDLHFQSSVDSVKEVFQAQARVELFENLSEYHGEIIQCSSELKSHISSPSSQSIVSKVSPFVEEKSEIYSPVQRHIHSEASTFTEEELEKVLEISPFLDRTPLIEEDIAYILRVFKKNSDYFSSLNSPPKIGMVA